MAIMESSQYPSPKQIKNHLEMLDYRDSELVIGLVCAVGADYTPVAESIKELLSRYKYSTQVIKISDLIQRLTDRPLAEPSSEIGRIEAHMDAGNEVCRRTERADIWALAAVGEIA